MENDHFHRYNRHSIRLRGYDYSNAGLYFITICCQNRACLFGQINDGILNLNDAGKMVDRWYAELENKYPDKKCLDRIVMPNHFHCIIENRGHEIGMPDVNSCKTIGDAMCWFKTMTTNEYIRCVKSSGWKPFAGKLWQRNYYERIIRDERSYQIVSRYIINNPVRWNEDKLKTTGTGHVFMM